MWKVCFTLMILLLMPSLFHNVFSDTSGFNEPETYKRILAVYDEINSTNSGSDSSILQYAASSGCSDANQNGGYYQCTYQHSRNGDADKFPGGITSWRLETDLTQGDMTAHQKFFDNALAYYSDVSKAKTNRGLDVTYEDTQIGGHKARIFTEYSGSHYLVTLILWGDSSFYSESGVSAHGPFSNDVDMTSDEKATYGKMTRDLALKNAQDLENKLEQHQVYNVMVGGVQAPASTGTQQTNATNNQQEITGTITFLKADQVAIIQRADGTTVDATVGMVLHKGDKVSLLMSGNPFDKQAEIDFGYGKLGMFPQTSIQINDAVLKDNLAKVQAKLLQGSIYENIQKPIEQKYYKPGIRSDFSVSTPTCNSSIRGSDMIVSYDNTTNTTTVYVTEDEAYVKGNSDSQEISIAANQKVTVGSDGTASTPVAFTPDQLSPTSGTQNQSQGELVQTKISIPGWIKNNAKWWSEGQIGDDEFVKGIQYLIQKSIMKIPPGHAGTGTSQQIPKWIKNNAQWWSNGSIGDDEFVKGIQYLITNGIMKIK